MSHNRTLRWLSLLLATIIVVAVALVSWLARPFAGREGLEVSLDQLGVYGDVPAFALMERSGRRVTRDDLKGHVSVVDFIYTDCTDTCPTQSLQFAQLQTEFAAASRFRLVSITVDPSHDTPAVLREYAARYHAGDRWWFLTGTESEIYCLAKEGFHLGVVDPAGQPPTCGTALRFGPAPAWAHHGGKALVMHSSRFGLVDGRGRIRAYHLTNDAEAIAKLKTNVRRLLGENRES